MKIKIKVRQFKHDTQGEHCALGPIYRVINQKQIRIPSGTGGCTSKRLLWKDISTVWYRNEEWELMKDQYNDWTLYLPCDTTLRHMGIKSTFRA